MTKTYAPKHDGKAGNVVQIGNFEMYFEDFPARRKSQGLPLILLHGFGGCTQNWHPFVDALSEDHRLIVVDLRGHGHSTNPQNTFTHKQAAEDVFLLLEKLEITRFSAMGMSTGGMTLLHMATTQAGRISSLVLISATTHFPEQARAIMRRSSFDTMPPEVKDMYRECAKRGDEQIRQLIQQFNAFHENQDDVNFSAAELAAITARTLIIHGDRDNFFPVEIPQNLYRAIPGASLWIIPGGDHVPIFDPAIPFATRALLFLNEDGGLR